MTTTEAGDLPSEMIEAGVKAAEARFWEDVPPEDVAAIFAAMRPHDPEIASLREQVAAKDRRLVDVVASLAAAISLLERGGGAAKKAAPSDKMFDQMLLDYKASLERARATLKDSSR